MAGFRESSPDALEAEIRTALRNRVAGVEPPLDVWGRIVNKAGWVASDAPRHHHGIRRKNSIDSGSVVYPLSRRRADQFPIVIFEVCGMIKYTNWAFLVCFEALPVQPRKRKYKTGLERKLP